MLARKQHVPVRGHHLSLEQVVEREPVGSEQVADPAAEGQPGDAGRPERPAGRREAVPLADGIEVVPGCAAACLGHPLDLVYRDLAQEAKVEHQTAVADGMARHVVTATANGQR